MQYTKYIAKNITRVWTTIMQTCPQKCSSLFACLRYTENDSSIFSTFVFFLASFWTCLTRMSLRSSTRQEHTYSNFRVEKIYIRRWTRERVHECLRNVIPCVLYFLHLTLCPRSSCENNSSHLVIYLFT